MKSAGVLVFILPLLFGCAYPAYVVPPTSLVEIPLDQRRPYPVSMYIDRQLERLGREVRPKGQCMAHGFPLFAGDAVGPTFRAANEEIFSDVVPGGDRTRGADDATRHIVYQLEWFEPQLEYELILIGSTAIANVEIAVKVTVYDESGIRVMRTVVVGRGYAEHDGQCGNGAVALAAATEIALQRLAEHYALEIVNNV